MRWLAYGVSLMVLLSACAPAQGADNVTSFVLEYATGSIPPPYNYGYRIEGRRQGDRLDLMYALTYRHRDGISAEELAEKGYSSADDIEWSTSMTGDGSRAWLEAAARSEPRAGAQPQAPGSDSIQLTVSFTDGSQRSGEPTNRKVLQELASGLDRQARAAIGHPRASP